MIRHGLTELYVAVAAVVAAALLSLCGCGASALQTHGRAVVALHEGCLEARKLVTAQITEAQNECVAQTRPGVERGLCLDHVEAAYFTAAEGVDSCEGASAAYAAGLVAVEDGDTADLVTLAARAWEAYRSIARLLGIGGVS